MSPGDELTLVLRRSPDADPNASVPKGGEGGETFEVVVTLGSRDEWTGTIGRGWPHGKIPGLPRGAHEQRVLELAQQHGILDHETGLHKLMAHLEGVQDAALDPNAMTHIIRAFRSPLSLDTIAQDLTNTLTPIRDDRSPKTSDRLKAIGAVTPLLNSSGNLRGTSGFGWARSNSRSLMRTMRDQWTIDPALASEQIGVMRNVDFAWSYDHVGWLFPLKELARAAEAIDLSQPPGQIGTVTLGTPGDDTHDMTKINAVLDPGGNDTYIWSEPPQGDERRDTQLIIDLAGDDRYESSADFAGPGVGVYAGSLIDDHAGNDTYVSTGMGSIAMGHFGVGVIIDRAGDDVYDNTGPNSGWSQGVGFYGLGLIVDQSGHDTYLAEKLSQGVGGPRGVGAILDARGNDVYLASGPNFPSAYGTPGVSLGMSQGFGFGVRGYAAGGIGVIDDAQGNDQYTAGEFSQGGGYYFGLGLLRDRSGNDLYHGNRYGQAFAAHQAVGVLIDDAGDDTYWSKTAASQSGAWDESITLLWDKQGNDAYRIDGLGLGAAAMQSIALFVDGSGSDRYSANPGDVLGRSSRDTYHFDTARVHSFSCFMDLGGGNDAYPTGLRSNHSDVSTGEPNDADPQNATLHGVFLDE